MGKELKAYLFQVPFHMRNLRPNEMKQLTIGDLRVETETVHGWLRT